MAKTLEVSPEEFNRELMKKHHSDMVSAIKSIRIPEPQDNSKLISQLNTTINDLTKKLEVLKTPNIILPKQEINQKEFVTLLTSLTNEIKNIKTELTVIQKPKEWVFDVIRNSHGFIQSVEAKAK